MKKTLEKAREMAETERAQLMGLVRTLEMKIAEQNQNAREERWALQQATATLTAKASALDREADYNRALLEREREQIKVLKESILAEQERNVLMLTEQRLAIEAEKTRLETVAKLKQNYDPQIARVEIETAVQVKFYNYYCGLIKKHFFINLGCKRSCGINGSRKRKITTSTIRIGIDKT